MALGDYLGRYNACYGSYSWGGLAVNSSYLYEGKDSGSLYGSSLFYRATLSGNCINYVSGNFGYCGGITATDSYVFVSDIPSSYPPVRRCPIDLSSQTDIISRGNNSNQLQAPRGLYYLTAKDYLFTTDIVLHKVLVTDKNGQYITHLGSYGTAIGNFNAPTDCVVMGDYLYVCDFNNNRIQIVNINTWEFQSTTIPVTLPCAIDAFENYLYITSQGTNNHVVLLVYKITNGVEYEQKFNQDLYIPTDNNRKIIYPRWASLAVDSGKIYIGCNREGDTSDLYIYVYKNEIETYLDQKVAIVSCLGGIDCATMQIPVTHASDMMGTLRNIPISIEASGYRQDNRVEQPILIQASGFAGQFGTSPEGIRISMEASADVSGIIQQIPVEILATINSAEAWVSPIHMTGEILKTVDATLDLAFPSFSVKASTPMIAQAQLTFDEITGDGLCGMDEIAEGVCLIDIVSGGDTGIVGYAIIDSAISEGLLTEDIYIIGSEALISLVSEGQAWINPNATGGVILDISADGDMAVSPSIYGGAIISVIADGQSHTTPVIRGEGLIEIVAEGVYIQDAIATGRANIDLMEAYGYIELPVVQTSKLQVVSIPIKAVTLYDTQALATTNHLDTLYIANNSGLYKETSATDTSQVTVKLPPLDVEKPLAGLTHELFISGDNDLPTVNVELENGDTFNAQVDSMAKKKGEIRVKFGKGLRGRYKIIKLTTSGKLDIDAIRYKGEKTTRVR